MDYQKTLNLPKTDFSMKAGLVNKEPALVEQWEKDGLYAQIRKSGEGKESYILHDGPPYANGDIHMGHALNKILKDIIVKFRTMEGYDSVYLPGWDCHGLPIEHQLFKKLKKKKSDVDTVDFRKQAHEFAMKYVGIQRDQFIRLGIFGEWKDPYLTLDAEYEYWIIKSLAELTRKGYIYRGLKPVNWCAECETALAEAEVEYEDHTSPSVYVKFRVNNPEQFTDLPAGKGLSLLIWTTTPWTLLANVAVAVHTNYIYNFVDTGGEVLIIESSLTNTVLEKAGIKNFDVVMDVKGTDLKDVVYTHPFGVKENCRVIGVDYVTKEDGTGLVHTAPGHGQEDFEAGLAHNLDVVMPVTDRGIFTDQAGQFSGQHVFKANPNIIEELKNNGGLFHSEDITHSYPHCWRCKKPVIFRATKQWFLKIDHEGLRGRLKDIVKKDVKWIPESGEERMLGMVSNRPDWCLSRQRHWGVPIPAVKCKGSDNEHRLFPEVIDRFADIVKKEGTNAWFEKDISELVPKGFKCPETGSEKFEKTYDILDVWFDSGVSHQAVVKAILKKELPIDMYLEGSDQHRGWFQSSIIPAVAMEGKAPFKEVLTHGFVVDGNGRKMSKSLGNVMSPLDIIKNSGADILRLWVASSNYNDDIRLSKEIFDRMIDAYRKIRNTVRYLLGNLNGYDPQKNEVKYKDLLGIDQWALNRLYEVTKEIKEAYGQYDFSRVYRLIFSFCNEDLSSFYLDILKDRLYTAASESVERRSAQTVLFHILNHLVRVLAPVLCFTSEEIYAAMPKDQSMKDTSSVHLLSWVEPPAQWANGDLDEKFKFLVDLRPFVLVALEDKRRTGGIGSSLDAKLVFQTSSDRDFESLTKFKAMLPSTFIVSDVDVQQTDKVSNPIGSQFPKTAVIVEKASGQKCSRCWNYRESVGKDPEHPSICGRCVEAVKTFANV